MTDLYVTERCGCGARIKLPCAGDAMGFVEEWRASHRHEFAPAHPEHHDEPPFIDETSSSHELAPRYPMGFMAEPAEGWQELYRAYISAI